MRSVWKGSIKFSLVNIPIQIFNAIESKNKISFKQLHNKDNGGIGYKKVCKSCNEEVPYGDIVKGYEYEPDKFVVIQPDEISAVKVKSNKSIEVEAFVDLDEVHPSRFESVYYIGPNGESAKSTYYLFVETLKRKDKAAVGKIVFRDKEDVILMKPYRNGLILYKLRYPEELRAIEKVPDLEDYKVDESQLKLAETLVESMDKSFEEVVFKDSYRDALMAMVQDKVAGKQIVSLEEGTADEAPVVDIMSALKASIEQAKEKKSA